MASDWPGQFSLSLRTLLIGVALVTAGCAGIPSQDDPGTQTTTEEQTTVPRATYPEPPSNLTNHTVEQVALAHEEARLQNHLREKYALTSFSMGYLQRPEATVVNRSDDGVYVQTNGTYSYSYDQVASDFNPVCSLYHVNQTTIRHVSELTCET